MPRTFVDRGGTFTDVVVVEDDGAVRVRKVPSDRAVVGDLARGELVFGTTVATNALLERAGVPTLLLVDEGLEDLPWIGDMTRPALFEPEATRPPPLCDRAVGVPGRIAADGTVEVAPALPDDLDLEGIEGVAVCLRHGPAAPEAEEELAAAVRRSAPGAHVVAGHAVDPEVGLLARVETALVDAAITPVLRRALERDRIPEGARAMRSDGSLVDATALRAPEAVLSGPAGGVLAVAAIAELAGFERAVGLDMGGTSTDVCRVDRGALPHREGHLEVAGVRLRRPMLEVETIAAGGGSVLTSDGLRLAVGPRSAGADPGPQCYGRGGPPTLTDAALACGLVDPEAFDPPLRPDRVDLPDEAEAFLDVARESMAAAVRRLATARGVDLRDHALVAYGGAAGQHAAEVAARLGIDTVLVHPLAGVLSAWGQSLARREATAVRAVWAPLEDVLAELPDRVAALRDSLPELGRWEATVELRPRGTDHALAVRFHPGDGANALRDRFEEAHRERYGFVRERGALEVVNLVVHVAAPAPTPPEVTDDPWGLGDEERAGPCRLTAPTTAVWVPEGWCARRERGLLRLDRTTRTARPAATVRTPRGAALWGRRFMAVAEQAGEVLQRLARSVNIRERHDFSCAVFDGSGHLVANAPHIPVHLGAMGGTVRDLLRNTPDLPDGSAWLTNDPGAGGSHLPDLTVVTPVHHEGHRFFVACRGHHVDVGGLTAGSMPPRSRSLADEGLVLRRLPLLRDGRLRPDLDEHLAESRDPATLRADLEAQVAANHHAARLLRELGPAELLATWMGHLQDVAEEAVARVLEDLPAGRAEDTLDGLPLRVALEVRDGRLQVDFTGTGGPHPGNLNTPRAVVRAAVLYALRVLVDRDLPLNEGALRRVDLHLPSPSLLDPPADAAVVGGNVETSQRLVDLVLRATGRQAAGPGSMSNLTLGGAGFSLYETLGGGEGASARAPGATARQVHMTNTRATDPEVLERRLPLRVIRFGRRPDTGGDGQHRGGDGLVRELDVTTDARAALLAAWRPAGSPGLNGAGSGVPGRARLRREGTWEDWDGDPVDLASGDRIRVETPGGGGWDPP